MATRWTNKQRAFVDEYFVDFNGTQAAIRAGYPEASAASVASENLRKPHIAAEVARRMEVRAMSANEALAAMTDMARANISSFVEIDDGGVPHINFTKAQESKQLGLIKKIAWGKDTISFELYDRQRAVELMLKRHGLLGADVNVNLDFELIKRVVKALEAAGVDPNSVFEGLITEVTDASADLDPSDNRAEGD
ncbi:MAG: terminase small subunit [Anaerolineae bacterium]|nr:terminase small subunit [Anaerolineae bacterium]